MRKILIAAAAVLVATTVDAQLNVGAKAGLNYSIYGTKIDPEPDEKPDNGTGIGFHLGGYAEIGLTDVLAFRPELLFSLRGTQSESTSTTTTDFFGTTTVVETKTDDKQNLSYIEVPLLLAYKPNENFGVHFGPGVGLLMGSKTTSEGTSTTTTTTGGNSSTSTTNVNFESTSTDGLRGVELGLAVGAAYELESGLNFGLRYWRGLSTLNEDTEFAGTTFKTHANVIQFSVGYTFIKN